MVCPSYSFRKDLVPRIILDLVSELVLLMFLALADALYLWLMQGIDFPPGTAFL